MANERYVMLPAEPTEEMIDAAMIATVPAYQRDQAFAIWYRAMRDAALQSSGLKTIAELAAEKFEAQERVKMLGMSNVAFQSYDERKKSAIAYAEAQAVAFRAADALDAAIREPSRIDLNQPRGLSAAEGASPEGVNNTIAESGDNKRG